MHRCHKDESRLRLHKVGRMISFSLIVLSFSYRFYDEILEPAETPVLLEQTDSLSDDLIGSLMQNHGYFSCNALRLFEIVFLILPIFHYLE